VSRNTTSAQPAKARRPSTAKGLESRESGELTRERILDSAERLFAQDGVDAVSLRRICEDCGVNPASIHYHFRTKEGVIAAILERGLPAWEANRDAYLDPLERKADPTLEEIVEAMVLPVVNVAHDPERATFLQFLVGLSGAPRHSHLFAGIADRYTERHLRLLERVTPDLPDHVRSWRYALTRGFLYYALAWSGDPVRSWLHEDGSVDDTAFQRDLVHYFAGALAAPVGDQRSQGPKAQPSR
jgi:AcrR family transcriptional regulator